MYIFMYSPNLGVCGGFPLNLIGCVSKNVRACFETTWVWPRCFVPMRIRDVVPAKTCIMAHPHLYLYTCCIVFPRTGQICNSNASFCVCCMCMATSVGQTTRWISRFPRDFPHFPRSQSFWQRSSGAKCKQSFP